MLRVTVRLLGGRTAFNITARLANTFGLTLASHKGFDSGAKYLLARGYR